MTRRDYTAGRVAVRAGQHYLGRRAGAPARRVRVTRVGWRNEQRVATLREVTRTGRDKRGGSTFPHLLTFDREVDAWVMGPFYEEVTSC